MVGSPWWMSPEMIRGEPHGLETDIWSFGILLLEMINGQPPYRWICFAIQLISSFRKSSVKAMFVAATEGYTSLPLSKRHRWSPELVDFLQACLKTDPSERLTTSKYERKTTSPYSFIQAQIAQVVKKATEETRDGRTIQILPQSKWIELYRSYFKYRQFYSRFRCNYNPLASWNKAFGRKD